MKLLLVKKGKNQYDLVSPETFGMETWGSSSYQVGLKKKRKFWYIEFWSYGGEYLDDELDETKLNVVKETSDIDEIIRYLNEHNIKEIQHIYEEAKKIFNEHIEFMKWINRGD